MKALILIDIQNDFLPGGSLEVKGSDAIFPIVNQIQSKFELIIATQDWHPANHKSFASNHEGFKVFDQTTLGGLKQTLWPDHCIQGTKGAEFSERLNQNKIEVVFRKGTSTEIDSYSGFYDNGKLKSTAMAEYLRGKGVKEVYLCGLAGDVCVYYSAKDALNEGFRTNIIVDGCKALNEEVFQQQLKELKGKQVRILKAEEL